MLTCHLKCSPEIDGVFEKVLCKVIKKGGSLLIPSVVSYLWTKVQLLSYIKNSFRIDVMFT